MAFAILVLLLVAALAVLWILSRREPAGFHTAAQDRDQERQLAELRAMIGYRPDLSWKAASRPASASTSRATRLGRGWNGSHRTSPSA